MKERFNLSKADPKAFDAMLNLEKYLAESGLDKILFELIKTRASQINGCAYCINMHVRDAMKIGETSQRLFLLDAGARLLCLQKKNELFWHLQKP